MNENPDIETKADAFEVLDTLKGRSIISAEFANELANAFGVELLDPQADIVAPASDLLHVDDDSLAVAVHDLTRHLVTELGGEPQEGSPLIGRGSGADFEHGKNYPKLKELAQEEDDD